MSSIFPLREDYQAFIEKFSKSIPPEVCFYLYGSFLRDDFVSGRSDLDGGLVVDSNVVIPKDIYWGLSRNLATCLDEFLGVRANFNMGDRVTNEDGRFMSYTNDYTDFLKKEGKIICGEDFIAEMNGLNYKYSDLQSVAFNLRKIRNGFLTLLWRRSHDPRNAFESVSKTFNILSGTPKKLINIRERKLILQRESVLEVLLEMLPNFDPSIIKRVNLLRQDPGAYERATEDLGFYAEVVTSVEEMIREYLTEFPEISEMEVRI